jgi:hypothetical protein
MSKKITKSDFGLLNDYDDGQLFRLSLIHYSGYTTPVLEEVPRESKRALLTSEKSKTKVTTKKSREKAAICSLHPELFLEEEKGTPKMVPGVRASPGCYTSGSGIVRRRVTGKVRGVTSPTQSSKTQWTVAQALLALNGGRSAIIVPRNFTGDQLQLRERVRNIERCVTELLRAAGGSETYSVRCLTSLSDARGAARRRHEAFHTGGHLLIALANSKQLQNLVKDSEEYPGSYDLFIDEADASDYGKESKSQEDVKRAVAFEVLKSRAHRTFCISATLMGVVLNEPTMLSRDLIRLTPPEDYRGFQEIADSAKVLKHRVHGFNKYRSWDEWIEKDNNLLSFLTEFSERDPHLIGVGRPEGPRLHPQICLLNVTTSIASHKSIVEGIAAHPHLSENLVVIGVNGDGTGLYLPCAEDKYEFILNGDESSPLPLEPCKFTRNRRLTISSVLQHIYEANELVNAGHADIEGRLEYGNIVIVSGRCVGRGISVVSDNYKYHLPTMYFTPSPTMNIPNLIQAMGRLCGRNLGKAPLELWATAEVWDCLHRGLLCEEELLVRAVGKPLIVDQTEQPLAESVRAIPINRAKIPLARRSLTKGKDNTRKTLHLVGVADGGRDLKDYLLTDGATSLPITLSGTLEKMFRRWADPSNKSKIAITARDLDPHTAYNVKDWSNDFVRLSDIVISDKTLRSHGHKPFMYRQGDIVQVHPKLVDLFEQYFG